MPPTDNAHLRPLTPQETEITRHQAWKRSRTHPLFYLKLLLKAAILALGWYLGALYLQPLGTYSSLVGLLLASIAAEFALNPLQTHIEKPYLEEETTKLLQNHTLP